MAEACGDHKTEYPLAAEAVKNSCYMDDLMPSVETVETTKEMRQQLTKLGDKADSIFENGYLKSPRLSRTYQKLIEQLK